MKPFIPRWIEVPFLVVLVVGAAALMIWRPGGHEADILAIPILLIVLWRWWPPEERS